jgi:alpha-mannosidase
VVRGCGIDEIYDEPWEYISDLQKESSAIARESLTHILPGKEHGIFIAVFNPNNWTVMNWVEAGVKLGEGWAKEPGIALNETEIPSQPVETSRWDDGSVSMTRIGFMAEVPPLSCRIYEMIKKKKIFKSKIQIKDDEIQNQFFNVKVNKKNGTIFVSDLDGNPILGGNEIIIDEELGDLYFHKSLLSKYIGSESGQGLHFGAFKPEELSVKKGPVRTEVSFKSSFYCLRWPYYLIDKYDPVLFRHKTVEVLKKVIVYRDIPRIDFEIRLNLFQPHVRIRLRFDTCMVAPSYTRQTHFGVLELPRDKTLRETHKVPTLRWLAGQEGGRGVALLTHGMPINEIKGGEIFCTLLRSVSVLSADGVSGPLIPTPKAQELGEHSYSCSIYPYRGDWRDAQIHRRDFEVRQPLYSLKLDKKPDFDEYSSSILLEPDNLVVSAIKKAESDDSVILRFFETKGRPCRAALGLPPSIRAVESVNLLEEEEGRSFELDNGKCHLDVGPFEIVTLKLMR